MARTEKEKDKYIAASAKKVVPGVKTSAVKSKKSGVNNLAGKENTRPDGQRSKQNAASTTITSATNPEIENLQERIKELEGMLKFGE